jgi:hypothetical protein
MDFQERAWTCGLDSSGSGSVVGTYEYSNEQYGLVEVNWHFRKVYCIHIQGQSVCLVGKHAACLLFNQNGDKLLSYYAVSHPEDSVISIITAMRTSDLTSMNTYVD